MALIEETRRLLVERGVEDDSVNLILAAMGGGERLEAALVGDCAEDAGTKDTASGPGGAAGAYLTAIEVSGFRGIGDKARLEIQPGPGLTVVAGRNGSGKSSFAEGLEVLLTGDSYRWKNKPVEWKRGWRNLHIPTGARVSAEFAVEGTNHPTVLSRQWDDGAKDASEADTVVQVHGATPTDLAGFGWSDAVELYRPLLSHSELGVVADDPSKLFDALSGVLGLDEVSEASEHIRRRRLEAEKPLKDARKRLKDQLLPDLEGSDDPRAASAGVALGGRQWDLEAAAVLASGGATPADGADVLAAISRLAVPDADDVEKCAARLETTARELRELAGSESGRSARTVDLLEMALAEHADHGDQPCPVCGIGSLDSSWLQKAEAQVAELRQQAAVFDAASAEADQAARAALDLIRSVPAELIAAVDGVDTDAGREAWEAWASAPDDSEALASHLRVQHPPLEKAVAAVAGEARARLAEQEEAWQPLAVRLGSFVEEATAAQVADTVAKRLKRAEDELANVEAELRSQRFQPIADQAIELWESLRLESNVELTGVELTGSRTRRRVDLAVKVDGTDGAALGVVSQGEVNCLALSLFFPRVMLPDSPFRFIVIDDPVQAMDPSRVDGLARVFARIAETRQLVVFTHDDRLPASLHRLDLPHTSLQVTRRPGSMVSVKRTVDPVIQYFLDARAVSKDDDLPDSVASRVVPGLCRLGIEAASMEAVRRRRIGRGDPHTSVEAVLLAAKGTTALVALALFDDGDQGGKVLGAINRKWGRVAGDAYRDCNSGAHKGFHGSLDSLIDESKKLATGLRVQ